MHDLFKLETTKIPLPTGDQPKGKFKIVSEDGTSQNTKLYYNDVQLEGVTNLNINLDADLGYAQACFTVILPMFNLELPEDNVKFIPYIDDGGDKTK